jgi:hypothetical protein
MIGGERICPPNQTPRETPSGKPDGGYGPFSISCSWLDTPAHGGKGYLVPEEHSYRALKQLISHENLQ